MPNMCIRTSDALGRDGLRHRRFRSVAQAATIEQLLHWGFASAKEKSCSAVDAPARWLSLREVAMAVWRPTASGTDQKWVSVGGISPQERPRRAAVGSCL